MEVHFSVWYITLYTLKWCQLCKEKPSLDIFACAGNVYLSFFFFFFSFLQRLISVYVINICLFHSMEITGMLYILPTVVLQVEAYLYYETINKTILSFWDVFVTQHVFSNIL